MKVLLTGAFGNVGLNTIKELLKKEYEIICFDIPNSKNMKTQKRALKCGDFKTIWGDITNYEDVKKAVDHIDAIIHLAAIIPPLSEKNPELAYRVNVKGTENLLKAAKESSKNVRFIFASSCSVYGSTMHKTPPRKVNEELRPMDNYSSHKIKAESMIKESGLDYMILRLGAVSIPKIPNRLDPILFEVPLDQRIEFVDSRDCAKAFVNAIDVNAKNKILNIGGGKKCQIYQREYIKTMFEALGISMLPDSAFKKPNNDDDWFYVDWLDTEESQKFLKYQEHTFEDYIKELRKDVAWRRFGTTLVKPFVKLSLLIMSPYYKFSKKDEKEFEEFDIEKIHKLTLENQEKINMLEERIRNLELIIESLRNENYLKHYE